MMLPLSLRSRRRLEMRLDREGVPEIPLLGRYNHIRAEVALPEHRHGDILEVCFLIKGRQTYRVGGRDYHLRGGDIFVAFPNERHSTAGEPQEKGVLYWMMVRKARRGLFGLSREQSAALWKSLCELSPRHFRGSAKMKERLDAMTSLVHGRRFVLRPTFLASEALGFLLEVLRCAEAEHNPDGPAGRLKTVGYIQDHIDEPLGVPHLAAQAGLSTARFKARFKAETGVPPGEYVLRAKIAEARRRLASPRETVTDVAYGLGFSSSQYFATVFKRFTGATPTAALRKTGKSAMPRRR